MYEDTLFPILESIIFENSKEIAVRFSEDISPTLPSSALLIQCNDKNFPAEEIFRNEEYPRDVRVVLAENVEYTGEFCTLYWEKISDMHGNTVDIEMTIPLRK